MLRAGVEVRAKEPRHVMGLWRVFFSSFFFRGSWNALSSMISDLRPSLKIEVQTIV